MVQKNKKYKLARQDNKVFVCINNEGGERERPSKSSSSKSISSSSSSSDSSVTVAAPFYGETKMKGRYLLGGTIRYYEHGISEIGLINQECR